MNRFSFVAGAAAAFLVAAGWSVLQSAPVAPAAADKTLGMALMSAVVSGGDVPAIVSGSGAVSVSRDFPGQADVVFDRDLSNCTCTASPVGFVVITGVTCPLGSPPNFSKIARVTTHNLSGDEVNFGFHLIVFCPK